MSAARLPERGTPHWAVPDMSFASRWLIGRRPLLGCRPKETTVAECHLAPRGRWKARNHSS